LALLAVFLGALAVPQKSLNKAEPSRAVLDARKRPLQSMLNLKVVFNFVMMLS